MSVRISSSARIASRAAIGTTPFVYSRNADTGVRTLTPAVGGVFVGEDVDIFDFANVDLGLERTTTICEGAKIDHFVHVAHDAVVGKHTVVCAGSIIAGFVEIGDRCTIGIGAVILPHVKIGDDCYVGAGAIVTRDVPPNTKVYSKPGEVVRTRNWNHLPWEGDTRA